MQVRSVLFAAGRGERLRPLTDEVAKPGLLVGDRPLGAYGLALLAGFGPTVVNLSHLAPETRAVLEPWAPSGTRFMIESPEPYGTAGTLAVLLDQLAARFVTLNADALLDLRVEDLVATHEASGGASATLAVAEVERLADLTAASGSAREAEPASQARPAESGSDIPRAARFIDRRAEPDTPGLRFIGMACFEKEAVAPLLGKGAADLGTAVLKPLVEAGEAALHLHPGLALDVGTPEALEQARALPFLARNRDRI